MKFIVGVDDHDSTKAGCTTHFSSILLEKLFLKNCKISELPKLVRLNPNIPWKTRGNASISFIVDCNISLCELEQLVSDTSEKYVKKISMGYNLNRKPGYAILEYDKYNLIKDKLESFYERAVSDVIPLDLAKKFAKNNKILIGGSRGLIGSIAALGFDEDYTFELLTYRKIENWNKDRDVDNKSIMEADSIFFPRVVANYDYFKNKPLILSHGRDPVFYGLRGTDPEILIKEMNTINAKEELDFFMIFKTNQMTDSHLKYLGTRYYQTTSMKIKINSIRIMKGGHVLIEGSDNEMLVIVYRESRELNSLAKELKRGDLIHVSGAIKPSFNNSKILEAERIEVLYLNDQINEIPLCPICKRRMESAGKDKGYRCKRCRTFANSKTTRSISRNITLGLYQSPLYRHLTKPIYLNLSKPEINEEELINNILSKMIKRQDRYVSTMVSS
ncbi:tRNA(Ile)(2)-agmatinylcytidine synthase [Sulfuracidifex metallicus]|uniref:tRNA(Ile2) 2-agmatinylcytidine synthetase TiaS n=2 Tax=Sulfuracidifex metallicus TaxID=47303 RepID=A0A6A9QLP9_SULME|nr:tRNA(Ile)(2)-agmatinylcytidine synthase [Sulfuracidifex metallicus]MUN28628.1 DUF1743 domain-containing protein [Sulfuracidifex metallicus DSM 6482 = JCM 9184]WOE50842.1 tRNA(Ile)(2)-agmatinylcytidine synthase [Sulfuracidifex metallicus DSM 6482 = JCM 9184]